MSVPTVSVKRLVDNLLTVMLAEADV